MERAERRRRKGSLEAEEEKEFIQKQEKEEFIQNGTRARRDS